MAKKASSTKTTKKASETKAKTNAAKAKVSASKTKKATKSVASKAAPSKTAVSKTKKTTVTKSTKSKATVKKSTTAKTTATKTATAKTKKTQTKTTTAKDKNKTQKNTTAKRPSKFRINQKIVYPSQGVGKITDISEQLFKNQKLMYYKIYIEASDMIVMVPVERAQELGIRAIVPAKEADKALNLLSEDFEPITSDWKLRYQMNLDLLKKGSIADIATIVRCLYNRSKVKELPILERKLYDSARKLLEDEIAFAMGKTQKEAETMIHTKLEPHGSMPKVKHIININDDEDDNLMDDINGNSSDGDDSQDDSYDDDSF